MIIIGIDEAGYGPTLGPLVITATGFDVPDAIAETSLWDVLRDSVTPRAGDRRGRLTVTDSKKLHRGRAGVGKLERTALAWLAAGPDAGPTTLRSLLARVCPHMVDALAEYPWYRDDDPTLPIDASATDIAICANALQRDLHANGIRVLGPWSEVLPAGHYNRMVDQTHNKAVVLFSLATRLIHRAAVEPHRHNQVHIVVDRQGGRDHYARPLMRAFEDRSLAIVEESPDRSGYRMTRGDSTWRIEFIKSGEDAHLPIALGSIFSKYIREVMMGCLNRFWQQRHPDLAPTGGYYVDAQRFLSDLGDTIDRERIDRNLLIRTR